MAAAWFAELIQALHEAQKAVRECERIIDRAAKDRPAAVPPDSVAPAPVEPLDVPGGDKVLKASSS